MSNFPKIKTVKPLANYRLLVTFENNHEKIYDCSPLLTEHPFTNLKNIALFKLVTVDAGGYGISWDDNIDLSEAELWQNGSTVNKANTLELV
jgi:hypothetical protein